MSAENSPLRSDKTASLTHGDVPQFTPAGMTRRGGRPFRFIQASDFRLDTPCHGVPGLPADVRDRFVEARYIAAERCFDAAIEHEVDFVVLPGGLLDAGLPGLRGPWFLAEQFRRLGRQEIDVYWAGASLETRGRWPAHLDLPTNVHRLASDAAGILHGRDGHPIARLLTISDSSVPQQRTGSPFTIAVQPRCDVVPEILGTAADYWALGGRPDYETLQMGAVVVHFAGSPQGRSPSEVGRHSCSLVQVDRRGAVRIEPLLTDLVRWHHRRLNIEPETSWSDLEELLTRQRGRLSDDATAEIHLVSWTVQGSGPAFERLLQPRFHDELIGRLNRRRPGGEPLIWTRAIETIAEPSKLAQWQQQTTPLGVFLSELEELAPTIPDMFGAARAGGHPLGQENVASPEHLRGQAACEGMHWLGTGQSTLRTAG